MRVTASSLLFLPVPASSRAIKQATNSDVVFFALDTLDQPVVVGSTVPVEEIAPVSDGQGRFRFRPLPPGRYTVRATARGWGSATRQAQVRAGRAAMVTFALPAAGGR